MKTKNGFWILAVFAVSMCYLPHGILAELRRSSVSYHLSFENQDFLEQDIIAQSGKMTLPERKIDFPPGRFGKGIRMNHIPEPITVETANGIDIDPVTAIVYNYYVLKNPRNFFEPAIWGAGKLNPRLGGVAFWAKGKPPYACRLFAQSSSAFGRKERDLIAVEIDVKGMLSAFLRDARYVRHELKTGAVWNANDWNHVVFNWDWAEGLELWLNGKKIASSWGTDGWFETMLPGLFQLSAPGFTYDEFNIFDRPVSAREIERLMAKNTPPAPESPVYTRAASDESRIARISGAGNSASLPVLTPGAATCIAEVWPRYAGDGYIQGWSILDGRNEMAWPVEYSFFTTTPGDADFHAGKVDFEIPDAAKVNYITLTGNLTDVKVQVGSAGMADAEDVARVPSGEQFFHGSLVNAAAGSTFRIPFTTGYGCPPDYQGEVITLPLSGSKRVHTVGFYHVEKSAGKPSGKTLPISLSPDVPDERYGFALHALSARDERTIAIASNEKPSGKPNAVSIGAFHRLNIMSEPFRDPTGVASVTLSLPVKTAKAEEALFIRVHDPAVPSRMWNQIAVRLSGFDREYRMLELTLDFHDLALTGGDRLWLDLGSAGECSVNLGDARNPSELTIATVPAWIAVDAWAEKEIVASKAQYSKMYEFMPWKVTGKTISLEAPDSFGGAFDMILPALAVLRVKPDHFVARFQQLMCGPTSRRIPVDGADVDPSLVPLKTLSDPHGAPDWAVYMREYLTYGHKVVNWWADRQNPDGQLGGGWNDDTLFVGHHQPYLPLDGNEKARAIMDSVHTKIVRTNYFRDGYCRISPMDRVHTGDLISERYNTVVQNLGQAFAAEREMESAWYDGHPERTPLNYGDGRAFRS
ncbi:MAG: LamG-like jellyroll fold domain-containing protein, partial [Candidatus Latescibacterota bacterium]